MLACLRAAEQSLRKEFEKHSHNGYSIDEHLCLKSHPPPSVTTESGAQSHLPSLSLPRELSLEPCVPGRSPERLGVVSDRTRSRPARRVGTGKRRGGHRKGVAGTPEPAAGRKESPGGPHPQQAAPGRQQASALGRASPASGDPGMSFRTEGQALSLIAGDSSLGRGVPGPVGTSSRPSGLVRF